MLEETGDKCLLVIILGIIFCIVTILGLFEYIYLKEKRDEQPNRYLYLCERTQA